MIEFKAMIVKGVTKRVTVVSGGTPPKTGHFYEMNRQQRRALVYARPVRRLCDKIARLRAEMQAAGICALPWPRQKSRKVLSGYMGALKTQARGEAGLAAELAIMKAEGW